MLYNISEFLSACKEDIGIKDIPMPVTDADLVQRIKNSALKEFSQRCPRRLDCILDDYDRIPDIEIEAYYARYAYKIPKHVYQDATILSVCDFDIAKPTGFSDYFMPQAMVGSPLTVLESIADIQMAAAMAAATSRAPSWDFRAPDTLFVFNGYTGGRYFVTLTVTHDISLSTLPPTTFSHFKQLTVLDLEEYLYNKLMRKDTIDTGIGQINLKIDRWENAGAQKLELLKSWDDGGANLDVDSASFY